MSQCSYCLPHHDGPMNHECSKGLDATEEVIDLITGEPTGEIRHLGYPKVGDGKCPEDKDHYVKQGQQYCPSICYNCKEQDSELISELCKKNVEEFKTIDDKKFYTGRPKEKDCKTFDPKEISVEVIT